MLHSPTQRMSIFTTIVHCGILFGVMQLRKMTDLSGVTVSVGVIVVPCTKPEPVSEGNVPESLLFPLDGSCNLLHSLGILNRTLQPEGKSSFWFAARLSVLEGLPSI
jgi:hypothetical protein